MTDVIHTEQLTGRKLANALTLLLSDLADAVDDRFPSNGDPKSAGYVRNYEAHRSAYAAVRAALVGVPAESEFRSLVLDFVRQAWDLTHGDPLHDDIVTRCIGRAADDYKPEVPDALRRDSVTKKPAPVVKVAPK